MSNSPLTDALETEISSSRQISWLDAYQTQMRLFEHARALEAALHEAEEERKFDNEAWDRDIKRLKAAEADLARVRGETKQQQVDSTERSTPSDRVAVKDIIEGYYRRWQKLVGASEDDVGAGCWSSYQCWLLIEEARMHGNNEARSKGQAEPKIELNFVQATELLQAFGGEPALITLSRDKDGLYLWHSEYPEEGAERLSNADDDAHPAESAKGQAEPVACPCCRSPNKDERNYVNYLGSSTYGVLCADDWHTAHPAESGKEVKAEFNGHHVFGNPNTDGSWGPPHCIYCGMWRNDDALPEKCPGSGKEGA